MSVDKFGRYAKQSKNFSDNTNIKLNTSGYYDMFNRKIVNIPAPVDDNDIVTKIYVDECIHDIQSKILKTTLILDNDAFDASLKRIKNLKTPNNSRDVANKFYVDSVINNLKTELLKKERELENKILKHVFDNQEKNNIKHSNLSNQIQIVIQSLPVMIESKCRMLIASELQKLEKIESTQYE